MRKKVIVLTFIAALCSFVLNAQTSENIKKGIELFEEEKYAESKAIFIEDINSGTDKFECYLYLGKILVYEKDFEEATEKLKKAAEINPQSSDAYLWLGISYINQLQAASFMEKGYYSGLAVDSYKKAVDVDPSNVAARIRLARYYLNAPFIAGGSTEKGKQQAEETMKYSSTEGRKLFADIYIKEEKPELAVEMYNEAIKNEPDNSDLYYQLGKLYEIKGEKDAARIEFTKAINMNLDEEKYKEALKSLD